MGLVIQCDDYGDHPVYENLPDTIKDAELAFKMMGAVCKSKKDIHILRNPDYKTISRFVAEQILQVIDESDPAVDKFTVFFYYGGHGEMINNNVAMVLNTPEKSKQLYLLESKMRAIASTEFKEVYVIGILDCCR